MFSQPLASPTQASRPAERAKPPFGQGEVTPDRAPRPMEGDKTVAASGQALARQGST